MSARRLSQRALAQAMGVSPAACAQLLNHEQWPRTTPREALVNAGVDFLREQGLSKQEAEAAFESAEPARSNAPEPLGIPTAEDETMLLRRQGLHPAARKHFSIFRDPFSEDVQAADDVFVSPDIRYVREALFQTAKHGGFLAVIGESGAGKSTLRRDLIDRIARESQPIVVIEPYVLGMEDNDAKGKTLKAAHIAEAIIACVTPLEPVKRSPEARFRQVHRVLRDSRRAGQSHVLVIEEAHGLSTPTIKHLKRFFELEDGFKKLLSIVLIGQPELALKLSETNHEVREVVQRCEVVELPPLDAQLETFLRFKFARIGKDIGEVIDAGGIAALRDKLTVSAGRRGTGAVSLLYPLAVGNVLTGALNLAADLGAPIVSADIIREI